ncbi:MAG: hypothetical protein R3B70_13040 [Polyangiaceae bacterium]
MQTRTKNALAALVLAAAGPRHLRAHAGSPGDLLRSPPSTVPQGAFVVAVAVSTRSKDVDRPQAPQQQREIPGLGKVRDVCGIDPIEHVREARLRHPRRRREGDFGIVASGDLPDDDLLACASKVIEQRGGRPVIANVGSFRTVRDATMVLSGAEIASPVKKGGPILFGAGAYLRRDDRRRRRSHPLRARLGIAYSRLSEQIRGTTLRATVVLPHRSGSPSLADKRGPPAPRRSSRARSAPPSVRTSPSTPSSPAGAGCAGWRRCCTKGPRRARRHGTRIAGFSKVLEGIQIRAEGETVQITAEIPADEAAVHRRAPADAPPHAPPHRRASPRRKSLPRAPPPPPPSPRPTQALPCDGATCADEVVTPNGDAGSPPRDGGSGDAGKP